MKRSVAMETTWFVVLTIVLVVLVEVFSQHFLTNHNREMAERRAQAALSTYALALQRQISFYQRLLEGLARRVDVHNLLEFDDHEKAFLWALSYRKLLPDTVGLSLVNLDGEILGNPASLLIGSMCRADIAALSHGKIIAAPAIHRERAGLEHFDLLVPVNDVSGERLGYLFASFRLSVVQGLLETMTHNDHKLTVVAADKTLIADIDRFTDGTEGAFELTEPVGGTSWKITLVSQPRVLI